MRRGTLWLLVRVRGFVIGHFCGGHGRNHVQAELADGSLLLLSNEQEEEAERVSVRADRMRARASDATEMLSEVRLDESEQRVR